MSRYPNWFAMGAIHYFEHHLRPLAGTPDLRFLQIGAFTGDASAWLLDNVLTGDGCELVDVDTWGGSDEPIHKTFDWADVERVYRDRTQKARIAGRVETRKTTSVDYFDSMVPQPQFDFVYIDGGHTAFDVLNDAVNAYRSLVVGGLLGFDDYTWQSGTPLKRQA